MTFVENRVKQRKEVHLPLEHLSFYEGVMYSLFIEYGWFPKFLQNIKFVPVVIDKDDIHFPNQNHKNSLNQNTVDNYQNFNSFRGIVRYNNGKFNVVDGYHRISSAIKHCKPVKVLLIVPRDCSTLPKNCKNISC